jgi:2,5-dihydroxypyridine 5,6-dioxygenase
MSMIAAQAALRAQELNPAKLTGLFRRQLELCNVKKGETVAVVADPGTRREYVLSTFAAAAELGADAYELCVSSVPGGWERAGVPTIGQCKGTLEALKAADLIVIFHVALFSKWLKIVRNAGVRVQQIIDAPDDLLLLQSPSGLKEAVLYAHELYSSTRKVRVTSDAGTDLTYAIGDFPVMSQYGYADMPGRFDHWGGGHIHTFPNEKSANGTVVFQPGDIVILPYCRFVTDEVQLTIRDGFITSVEGGLDAKLMTAWLDDCKENEGDQDPYAISHLGWGMNPQSLWYWMGMKGDHPERNRAAARSFAGNFLFSTGPNTEGGGTRATKGHYDVPMRECTVALDGKVILSKGQFVDDKLKVARVARDYDF